MGQSNISGNIGTRLLRAMGFYHYTSTYRIGPKPAVPSPAGLMDLDRYEFPLWPAILLLYLPLLFRMIGSMHKILPGQCANCGYDLRASQERCPECGTPIPL